MDPMRLITYTVLTAVVMLVAMGAAGFYIGYLAGRNNVKDVQALIAASTSPEHAATLSELLKKQEGTPPAAPDFTPVLEEIRSISAQIGRLEQTASVPHEKGAAADDSKVRDEIAGLRQRLTATSDQYNACRQDVNLLQARLKEPSPQPAPTGGNTQQKSASADPASVVLFDNVQLKRDQNKLYNDVDVALSLQAVASRSARVAVNQQSFGISFGERKIFQHKDVTCELVLMETDLEGNQARLSIACKR
jgi:hypothetical protein